MFGMIGSRLGKRRVPRSCGRISLILAQIPDDRPPIGDVVKVIPEALLGFGCEELKHGDKRLSDVLYISRHSSSKGRAPRG